MRSLAAIFRRRAGEETLAPVALVEPNATCADAVKAMAAERASAALVAEAGTGTAGPRLLGIVTEQDVVRRIAASLPPDAPVTAAMTSPVHVLDADEHLFRAIARMRRLGLRHMPMVGTDGSVRGVLDLHRAYAGAIADMVGLIDALTHERTVEGLREVKRAQARLAAALFEEALPAPDIQALLSDINRDIHARLAELVETELRESGWGEPPVRFCLIVMGSVGRRENFLFPDQDNGLVLDDYPDEAHGGIDPWFVEFARRLTAGLDAIGFPLCKGFVMATNPLWRKTRSQWREQLQRWFRQRLGQAARFADIFFDFAPAWGEAAFAGELRAAVTPLIAENAGFLRDVHDLQSDQATGLGWFGRIRTERGKGGRGGVNLKYRGTLPLVDAVRLLALRHRVADTSTLARIAALGASGTFDRNGRDELEGAFQHVTHLLLRQQLADLAAGRPAGNLVPLRALSRYDRRRLANSFRAIEALRQRVAVEIGGRTV